MSEFDNPYATDDFGTDIGLVFPSSRSKALDMIVNTFLENNTIDAYSDVNQIVEQVVALAQNEFQAHNENAPKGSKMTVPSDLTPSMIAKIMLRMYHICNINCAGAKSEREYDALGIYQEDGPDKGIYITSELEIQKMIHKFNSELNENQLNQAVKILQREAPRAERCNDRDLIAVNNGIFNYKTKIVEPFDPEKVFTAKCRVNYNPTAQNVTLHNDSDNTDWDIESWILELFDDPEVAECIWQILGAIIRPNVSWGKAALFVSQTGNNGKGSICSMMKNLVGEGSYASIPLSEFGTKFMLEPLIRSTAIITDENDVGTFIDKAANIKAVITNDTIYIDRKHKTPISYKCSLFMVQCANELVKVRDKTDSFYRRILYIPFNKCYTGSERKYIKDDYLKRTEVLEYVLYRVLNMNYYELDEPKVCREALAEYKEYNNPVLAFANDVLPRISLDCIPSQLAYDFFKAWSRKNNPNGTVQGKNTFLKDLQNTLDPKGEWRYFPDDKHQRVGKRMDCYEPLLDEYDLRDWMKGTFDMYDRTYIRSDRKPVMTAGLFRIQATAAQGQGNTAGGGSTDDNSGNPYIIPN